EGGRLPNTRSFLGCLCFNGATPERGWKGWRPRRLAREGRSPQWGRPRKRGEGKDGRVEARPRAGARVGAPPAEGGRGARGWRPTRARGLQWGDPRKRVEGSGRLRELGETAPLASVGPPPKEGGRHSV